MTRLGPPSTLAALSFRWPDFAGTTPGFKANETHISAQHTQARPHPRIPRPDGHEGRTFGPQTPPRERPRSSDAVNHSAADSRSAPGNGDTISRRYPFTRQNRLLTAAAYSRVFDKAQRSQDKWFTVLWRPDPDGKTRLGLAISKKHCRKATRRNLIKRIARESFRQHQHEIEGLDIVVINKPAAAAAMRKQLHASLLHHWNRLAKARPHDNG